MGSKSKEKKPKGAKKPEEVPKNVGENEFTRTIDKGNPWKDEGKTFVRTVDKESPWEETTEKKFNRTIDKGDPWERKTAKLEMPKRKERSGNSELGKAEVLPKQNYGERLRALRARMENREPPKYASREQPLWARPRGNKKKPSTYIDRMSRLGSIAGRRPATKKKKKKQN